MKELYNKAMEAHAKMLEIHIDTKTTDADFHEKTAKFYEVLFDVAHKIGEKHVDLWWSLSSMLLEEKKNKAHKLITNMIEEVNTHHKNNEITLGTEDLLGSLANSLEDIKGTSKSFLN